MSEVESKSDESETPKSNCTKTDNQDRIARASKLFQTGVVLVYGERRAIDKAIKCFQRAITYNDADYRYWRLLGEAYYQRGSFNPSINCFLKSINLAEKQNADDDEVDRERRVKDCTFSRLRMSDIRLAVGHLEEAVVGYKDIIDGEPNNVAALVGLAKTQLQLAKDAIFSTLGELDQSHCMDAIRHSLMAVDLSPHLCITLKTAADCCLTQFLHGPSGSFPKTLKDTPLNGSTQTIELDRLKCVELAQQFLCRAIAIEPFIKSSCLWHNLGITLYLKSTIVNKSEDRTKLLKRSLRCLLKALDFDRANSQVRNSIGVISYDLGLMNTAQSFFIKSIQTNMSTSEIQFSNLGYFYLQEGEYKLAGLAFGRCQAEEPLYSRSWPGNTIVNSQRTVDSLIDPKVCNQTCDEPLTHLMISSQIINSGIHTELIGDLRSALYCIRKCVNQAQDSVEAANTIGILCKRCRYEHRVFIIFD